MEQLSVWLAENPIVSFTIFILASLTVPPLIERLRLPGLVGLLLAGVFLAASMTPSLLPRPYLVQGILSGFAIAAGYSIGVLGLWGWRFLQFRDIPKTWHLRLRLLFGLPVALLILLVTGRMVFWQNSIRQLMQMEPLESAYPYRTLLIAAIFSLVLVLLGQNSASVRVSCRTCIVRFS